MASERGKALTATQPESFNTQHALENSYYGCVLCPYGVRADRAVLITGRGWAHPSCVEAADEYVPGEPEMASPDDPIVWGGAWRTALRELHRAVSEHDGSDADDARLADALKVAQKLAPPIPEPEDANAF